MRTRGLRLLRTWGLPALTALGLTLASADASAAGPSNEGKRFRFHGELDLLNFSHLNPDGPGDNINTIGFGFGKTTGVDRLLLVPSWSLGFGYVFLDGRAVAGGRFVFDLESYGEEDDTAPDVDGRTTDVSGQLVPYFRYIFLPGRRIRPFLEGRFGFGGSASSTRFEAPIDSEASISTIYPIVGFTGGAHFWIIDAFSIDAGLAFDYVAPHAKVRSEVGGTTTSTDYEKVADAINLAAQVGFSVWF